MYIRSQLKYCFLSSLSVRGGALCRAEKARRRGLTVCVCVGFGGQFSGTAQRALQPLRCALLVLLPMLPAVVPMVPMVPMVRPRELNPQGAPVRTSLRRRCGHQPKMPADGPAVCVHAERYWCR